MRVIHRFMVPVDDRIYPFDLPAATIVHVAVRRSGTVEFWADCHPGAPSAVRQFTVVGTGMQLPSEAVVHGTALDGVLVWHLIELP